MNSRDVIRAIEHAGWRLVRVVGSHHQFKHPGSRWVVTVVHPLKDIKPGTLRSIERKSGVKLR